MCVQAPTHKFEESNTARHEHAGMAEQSENVEYAGAAVASPLRQRNAGGLPGVTSATKGTHHDHATTTRRNQTRTAPGTPQTDHDPTGRGI